MLKSSKPVANPLVVLREEFDDWAILFDPDTGKGFGLNPVSLFVWKHLDSEHTIEDIVEDLSQNCKDVPEEVKNHVEEFIQQLVEKGLAGYEFQIN